MRVIPADRLHAGELRIAPHGVEQFSQIGAVALRQDEARTEGVLAVQRPGRQNADCGAVGLTEKHTADFGAAVTETAEPVYRLGADFFQDLNRIFDIGRVAFHAPATEIGWQGRNRHR